MPLLVLVGSLHLEQVRFLRSSARCQLNAPSCPVRCYFGRQHHFLKPVPDARSAVTSSRESVSRHFVRLDINASEQRNRNLWTSGSQGAAK